MMKIPDDPYVEQSLSKVQRSTEIAEDIISLCREYIISRDEKMLMRIGSFLGDFTNNLRSALNYCARTLITKQLQPHLAPNRYKKLKRRLDFPWASKKSDFDRSQTVKEIKEVSQDLYKAFERLQPYYQGNEWLGHLMILSNRDKHEIIINVESPTASSLVGIRPDGTPIDIPKFVGDKLIIFSDKGLIAGTLPFYFSPLRAFAAPDHTWKMFMVTMSERFSIDLIKFIRSTPIEVTRILAFLETSFGSYFDSL